MCLVRQQNIAICRESRKAGATGLEPATSGVTDQFEGREVDDGGHGTALFMGFCVLFRSESHG